MRSQALDSISVLNYKSLGGAYLIRRVRPAVRQQMALGSLHAIHLSKGIIVVFKSLDQQLLQGIICPVGRDRPAVRLHWAGDSL